MADFLNRELSWLEFNQRVLGEAEDAGVPLLERLNFLSITGSNLDEFFMVRVGGLQSLVQEGIHKRDSAGLSPSKQLQLIGARVRSMVQAQYACWSEQLAPALRQAGIERLQPEQLDGGQRRHVAHHFDGEVYPILAPTAVDIAAHRPLLGNLRPYLAVRIKTGRRKERFAIIPLGMHLPRFLPLPSDGGYRYMHLEDEVAMHVERLFPGETIVETVAFRMTRNADLPVREDSAPDLLTEMVEVLDARKESHCVRLEVEAKISAKLRKFLRELLNVSERDIYRIPGPLDLAAFRALASVDGFEELRYEPWSPQPSPSVDPAKSMFEVLSKSNVLLSHPYESFEPVVRLIEEAADDDDVLAIKQILYRTSSSSPIVAALERAARYGKYVTVVLELRARFDEERNIEWARRLEQAGVHVVYGVRGLKTHAKACVIVRREPHGIVRYVHFGTGNYNEKTARLYSDVGYMSCEENLGVDASAFFNAVTGYSQLLQFRQLVAAPVGMREEIVDLIDAEAQRKRQGQKAVIMAKMNSLIEPKVIRALYNASQAGVKIQLNVRGICCLRPGVPGLSDNITVISIIDRFLEHSRIFHFHHGGERRVYISSADWMPRNLLKRVELMVPIPDTAARDSLIRMLEVYFRDNMKSHRLTSDGQYVRQHAKSKRRQVRSQKVLYELACEAAAKRHQQSPSILEPYRARNRRKGGTRG
ncbi:MAG: polyphosphate kinase 1 [Chitinivibrionales bacterium]|nr:polyphosphate kinase 1 [Chitinivibrionales bacterium]MBD3358386.1 polyphosphate kinase 1 [Chitinivibrionales bacterium]